MFNFNYTNVVIIIYFLFSKKSINFYGKIPQENINTYIQQLKDEGKVISNVYPEIDLIRETELLKEKIRKISLLKKQILK